MKITIATPSFGSPKYLKECVESVSRQSIHAYHIVCGGELQLPSQITLPYLEIINQNPDPGMVSCWSNAASRATTEYIGFLADDNSFESCYAERMVSFLEANPECDLVFCNQSHMDAEGNIDIQKSDAFTQYFGRHLLPGGIMQQRHYRIMLEKGSVPVEASVIRRSTWEKFGPFSQQAMGSFDHEFINRILLNNVRIGFIPDYLMNFRIHEDAYTSRAKKEHLIGSIYTYETLMKSSKEYGNLFKTKIVVLKGRLLRYQIPFTERINIMKELLKEKSGPKEILKNSIAGLLNLARLRKN